MMFSAEFLTSNIPLDWPDILWGYKNQLVGWRIPIDIAKRKGSSQNPLEVQLANVGKDDDWRVSEILADLAASSPTPEALSKRKWLYLTLLWLYEHQDSLDDRLRQLEEVYADFDYPDEISAFIPFMPPEDSYNPSAYTLAENQKRLLDKWKDYLEATKASLS